jgi:ribokinase
MTNEKEKFNIIAIGDTTQDIFLDMDDLSVMCDLDGDNCRICFDYADKIPVNKKTDVAAVGNAANHAIGAGRLGLKTGIYTVVGNDDQGQKAKKIFSENGVVTDYMAFDKKNGTNLSIVINYKGERTIFVYHEPREYKLPELPETEWVYLTSASGEGVSLLHEQVVPYLDDNKDVKLAFNPGTFQMNLGRKKLIPLLERTEILFLNREESKRVLEVDTVDVEKLVSGFHSIGVKKMVLTDGPDGVYVSDGTEISFLKIFRGPVIERTGCGDAFGSGFLSALVKGKTIQEAMLWGNGNSTSVLQHIGAREGLLREDGIEKILKENSDITPGIWQSN